MYLELHARTAFSFLRGGSRPEEMAAFAAAQQVSAMAVCDRDGLYGAPLFTEAAKEQGIRPIVGAEITLEDESVLPVMVVNRTGYRNLSQLLTRAHLRAEKGKPRVRWDELPEFAQGLVALTGDEEGPLIATLARTGCFKLAADPTHTRRGEDATPCHVLQKLTRAFGHDNVFVEIQRHHLRGEERLNTALIELARAERLPLLATNGVLYAKPEGRQVLDVFTCLRHHTHLDGAGTLLAPNAERHLKSPQQMRALFHDLPEAIENTLRLGERLEFSLEDLGYEFPKYPVPDGHSMDSFLRERSFAGARQRYRGSAGKSTPPVGRGIETHREAGGRGILPHRLGHRRILSRAKHHVPGPRQRGQQHCLFLPGHHGGGPAEVQHPFRTLPQRGPKKVLAGHRH